MKPLKRAFYLRNTITVAKDLLGKYLVIQTTSKTKLARIVETEAYLGTKDPSAHSYKDLRTQRIKSMYLSGGHSYVYFIYGMYFCLNVSTQKEGRAEAVLIRAVEIMSEKANALPNTQVDARAGAGPGKLCRYLHITREHDGLDMTKKTSKLWIAGAPKLKPSQIVTSKRIGLSHEEAKHWPLRFYVKDSLSISKK